MELKVTLDYQQVLEIVRQLSANQVAKLLVDAKHILDQEKKNKDKSSFQKLLLSAPVMTDAQYDDFLDNRKKFNQWRKNKKAAHEKNRRRLFLF